MSGDARGEDADVAHRKKPHRVPAGVEVTLARGRSVAVTGPRDACSVTCPAPSRCAGGRPAPRRAARRRADQPGAARAHAQPGPEHGDRGHRRFHQGARDRRRRLPRHARRAPRSSSWRSASATPSSWTPPRGSPSRCRRPLRIIVKGIDKEAVGQVAADIRRVRKPEPYKGKGVRYAGEVVQRKAGKAAK